MSEGKFVQCITCNRKVPAGVSQCRCGAQIQTEAGGCIGCLIFIGLISSFIFFIFLGEKSQEGVLNFIKEQWYSITGEKKLTKKTTTQQSLKKHLKQQNPWKYLKRNSRDYIKATDLLLKSKMIFEDENMFQEYVHQINQIKSPRITNYLTSYISSPKKSQSSRLLAISALAFRTYPKKTLLMKTQYTLINQLRQIEERGLKKLYQDKKNTFRQTADLVEAEALIWALARLKTTLAENLIRKIRWKVGPYTVFWYRTEHAYDILLHLRKKVTFYKNSYRNFLYRGMIEVEASQLNKKKYLYSKYRKNIKKAKTNIWSAYLKFQKEKKLSIKLNGLLKCGILYQMVGDYRSAKEVYLTALNIAKAKKQFPYIEKITFYRIALAFERKQFLNVISLSKEFQRTPYLWSMVYYFRGKAYYFKGKTRECIQDFQDYNSFSYGRPYLQKWTQKIIKQYKIMGY